ncbi:hypothetical protein M0R72_03130 [Candidatus Pacearchaeota archaeon]|jgi:hypothetical protein|nr:hypothetical protein [Candidatus Pacearchaeota archaeon]
MKNKIKKQIIWVPRILIIAYILFLSLFALDTEFGLGFFMHLIPSFILLAILIFTWKKQKLAGILFEVFGIVTIFYYRTYQDLSTLSMISLPPIFIGALFYFLKNPKH